MHWPKRQQTNTAGKLTMAAVWRVYLGGRIMGCSVCRPLRCKHAYGGRRPARRATGQRLAERGR